MGGVQSADANNSTRPTATNLCSQNAALVQIELMKSAEFQNKYHVRLNSLNQLSYNNNILKCKADIFLTDIATGYTTQDNRIIELQDNGDALTVLSITQGGNQQNALYLTPEAVEKYYNDLHTYNQGWTAFRWKTSTKYDPPRPLWTDQLFEKNVDIYNNTFNAILQKNTGSAVNLQALESASNGFSQLTEIFQKYLSPLPADPVPPSPRIITVPKIETSSGSQSQSGSVMSDAAIRNMQAQVNNLDAYNAFLSIGDPDYDPPQLGDNYETVLLKYNKSYDITTTRRTNKAAMDAAGSDFPEQNRRLIGRVSGNAPLYRVPEPVIPPTNIPKADRYKAYNFNERQQYIVDYSPVSGVDRNLLVKNFCNSLGYEAYSDKLPGCEPGDCCAPMPSAPKYDATAARAAASAGASAGAGSVIAGSAEGFNSGSSGSGSGSGGSGSGRGSSGSGSGSSGTSASRRKCANGGISLAGRTTTISIPRPPIVIPAGNVTSAYKTSRANDPLSKQCTPKEIEEPNDKLDMTQLYDIIRPAFIKELQQELKGEKMFALRCPASQT